MNRGQILICDDDILFQIETKRHLASHFDCEVANHGDDALEVVKKRSIDLVLLDIHMRTEGEGFQFIPTLLEADPDLEIVIISHSNDFQSARKALQLGASDYVVKDRPEEELVHTVEKVLQRRSLLKRQQQQNFEASLSHSYNILVGKHPSVQKLLTIAEKIRARPANVVILGETGTGKELVARQLRRTLPDGSLVPFLAVDSATIQSSMAESILFGHEKGAFTGADKTTKGLFESANGGIVYFDEISNMPLSIQAKLLRVLQEKEVTRLGSSKNIQLNFQVVCATNKNLEEMVARGEFKEDLLQRLNVITIEAPPLRERIVDIPFLLEHFTRKWTHPLGRLKFAEDAIALMNAYSWPGNVRELENLVNSLATLADSLEVRATDLPARFHRTQENPALQAQANPSEHFSRLNSVTLKPSPYRPFYQQVSEFEQTLLKEAYRYYEGNVSKLASSLEVDRSSLHAKLKEYQIHIPRR